MTLFSYGAPTFRMRSSLIFDPGSDVGQAPTQPPRESTLAAISTRGCLEEMAGHLPEKHGDGIKAVEVYTHQTRSISL